MDRLLADRGAATEAVTPQRDSRSAPLHALGLTPSDAASSGKRLADGETEKKVLLVSKSGTALQAYIPGAAGALAS
eukprot:5669547-Prymnesium_polylepis.1